MINLFKKTFLNPRFIFLMALVLPFISLAQMPVNLDGELLLPRAEISTVPRGSDFFVGQNFDLPIYINTKGNSINTINLQLNFDQSKLAIVKPSFGRSIFGVWLEPPTYDNKNGTASFVGIIPNGIVTDSGLIATITFEALKSGKAEVVLNNYSSANLNDGFGSDVILNLNGSIFNIKPKAIPLPVASVSPVLPNKIIQVENNNVQEKTLATERVLPVRYFKNYDQFLRIILILLFIYLILTIYRRMFSYLDKQKNNELNRAENNSDSHLEN